MDIGRSIGLALLCIFGGVAMPAAARAAAAPVSAPVAAATQRPDVWIVYGTPDIPKRDNGVVGASSIVAPPHAAPADPWTSGAAVTIPQALATGQRFTFAFWAKAAAAETVPLLFQARGAPYPAFLTTSIALTPHWQLFIRSAVVPAPLAPGTQAVGLQLGRARSAVALGPVAMFDGPASRARIAAAFAAFHPDRVAEAVSFSSDPGVTLAGTLRTPVGHGPGPYPLAIFIQGHGPFGRGYSSPLMDRLLADGIATMAYDKRGINQSTGTYSEDLDALTRDAQCAVAAMRRRPDIDGRRIALIGHSQGGVIAPAVAAADQTIAAVVSLAGSVGDGLQYLRRALHNQMISAGRPEKVVAPAVDSAITLLQARIDNRDAQTIASLRTAVIDRFEAAGFPRPQAERALAMIDTEEARQANKLRSASDLKALHIPVLAVFGSKDPLVVASDEAAEARRALANNPRGKVVVLDGLSHWFQEGAKTGSQEESASLGPMSPRVVAVAGDWVRTVLAPAPARTRVPDALGKAGRRDETGGGTRTWQGAGRLLLTRRVAKQAP